MPKAKSQFVCNNCGSTQSKWMGKCPACGSWDSLEEVKLTPTDPHRGIADLNHPAQASHPADALTAPTATPIDDADPDDAEQHRIPTTIDEFDRVLGGGFVQGSVTLLGGDPGIGKSTLLLQAASALTKHNHRVLYASSEESAAQLKDRAQRLRATNTDHSKDLFVLADTNLARIAEQARTIKPDLLAIDSIQMVYKHDLDASPGSVAQLRRCALELTYLAKTTGIAVVLVGHVTKEGELAGPRFLEHLVDTVLSFEGERYHAHRLVRAVKNRFGSTLELGVFEMTSTGLQEVPDGASVSAADQRPPGSAICPVMTGSRCLLVELQSLVAPGFPGSVKRKASGLDANRLAMLIAVLEQHAGLRLHDMDVFTSAVGGLRIVEPAADLALALAIASAHRRLPLAPHTAAVGEVGLSGEIRPIPLAEPRIREAARLGYKNIILPQRSAKDLQHLTKSHQLQPIPINTISDAINILTA